MNVKLFRRAAALSLSVALGGVVAAQSSSPQQQPTPQQKPTPQATAGHDQHGGLHGMVGQTVTLTGCVAQERDVPGQTPNVTERAGVAPDYILTNVQMASASPSATATPAAPGTTPSTTVTPATPAAVPAPEASTESKAMSHAGAQTTVKLKQVDNDQMRANLNKQVEITGRVQMASESHMAGHTPSATDKPSATAPAGTPGTTGTGTGAGERVAGAAGSMMRGGGPNEPLPEVHVTSVRVLNQACTPAKQ